MVCFNYNHFLRERLQDCFTNPSEGVVFLTQFLIESSLMLQADVSVSILSPNENSNSKQAKVVDFEVESVMDLGRLMCRTGRLSYRRNCQLAYCLIFGNSLLVGCQIFVLYVGLPLTPIILQYEYSVDFMNMLMMSLPLIAYATFATSSESRKCPETKYSSWAVWRLVLAAVSIGMLAAAVNMSWMVESFTIFDLKISSFLNCVVLSNIFIGLVALTEPIAMKQRIMVWGLVIADMGLYCAWMSIVDLIKATDWYATTKS